MWTQDAGLDQLAVALGPQGLIREAAACQTAGTDWRGRYSGPVLAVARPANVAQAQMIVQWALATQTPLVPQGGNSSLAGGSVPLAQGPASLVLSTQRLNQVRHLDRQSKVMIAEAGVILETAQAAAAPLLLPVDLGARGTAQLGGLASTHAGGLNVVRFGALRSHILGLEAVLPNGEIWSGLGQVKKDNSGYALKDLLIGAEGTLGLITALSLQLHQAPAARFTAMIGCQSPAHALDILGAFDASFGGQIYAAELMPALGMQRAVEQNGSLPKPFGDTWPSHCLLLEVGLREALQTEEEALCLSLLTTHAGDQTLIAQSEDQRQQFWGLREGLVLAQRAYGASIKHDVCVPLAQVPTLIEEGVKLAQSIVPNCLPVPFGHLGDGSFHFNISRPEGGDDAAFFARTSEINQAIHDLVHRLGGSISAEHGLGQYRRDEAARLRDPAHSQVMAQIKGALDPQNLFNPGKVL